MRLVIEKYISNREIVHYADDKALITSHFNNVFVNKDGKGYTISLPVQGWKHIFGHFRLFRRLLRLDKCNVVPVGENFNELVIIREGRVYHYDAAKRKLTQKLRLANCRNVLHQSIAVINNRELFFGEYGANPKRRAIFVYRSIDGGKSWIKVFEFPAGKIKHVHGCYWDKYEKKIWVFTGDFNGENYILVTDRDFNHVEWLGNGKQEWRACNAFFEFENVYWIMDSSLEDNFLIKLDRKTSEIIKLSAFPGPVWYIKKTIDNLYIAATACEKGNAVHDNYAHIFVSRDAEQWNEVAKFQHDGLPKGYFKFGVIGFADGKQHSKRFYLFGEALKGLDGKGAVCALKDTEL